MAAEIAREIIAQSQGGGKMAFKFSPPQGSGIVVHDSLLLSSSKDANEKSIYHVHLTKEDKAYDATILKLVVHVTLSLLSCNLDPLQEPVSP
mmetsp:Transcript_12834/g.19354  ORF Transcript_12834/g.19354 Transcript_12834/m.19354 type:complete len:92 (+) Transcript_12834:82-357(+)